MPHESDELQENLQKLLHKSRNLRRQADVIDGEVDTLRKLTAANRPHEAEPQNDDRAAATPPKPSPRT